MSQHTRTQQNRYKSEETVDLIFRVVSPDGRRH